LKINELIEKSKLVIKGRLKLDWMSRFYKAPLFKISKKKINKESLAEIQTELLQNGIFSDISQSSRKYYLKVLRTDMNKPKQRWFINLFLFLLTIYTTTMVGAGFQGKDPFASFEELSSGFSYSFALLFILLAHEMGHYIYSKKYKIEVSLPYFIPLFLPAFHPGTMGAFIRMRSAIPDKKALFDVGVAGPLAGFIATLLILVAGFINLPDEAGVWEHVASIHPIDQSSGINFILGSSILLEIFKTIFDVHWMPMNEFYHFPLLFAGWFGLLVTALNLMPIGQLDGGHISYTLFGEKSRNVAVVAFFLLVALCIYLIIRFDVYTWVLWPLLILIFIRFRHPPTLNDQIPIGNKRKIIAWFSYVIFLICFIPMPIYIG